MALIHAGSRVKFNASREGLEGVRAVVCNVGFHDSDGSVVLGVVLLDGADAGKGAVAFGHEVERDILGAEFDFDAFLTAPAGVLS